MRDAYSNRANGPQDAIHVSQFSPRPDEDPARVDSRCEPRFERETNILAELLTRKLNGPRFAMLVIPDHWGEAPLSQAPAFRRRLREWSDAGVEMFVHGWLHKDQSKHSGYARLKARTMTASEGEFLGLSQEAAGQRMADGKALIEDIIGRAATGFVAPAWLYGKGAKHALAASGFALDEDHLRVWQPAKGPSRSAWAGGNLGQPQPVATAQFSRLCRSREACPEADESGAHRSPSRRRRRSGAAQQHRKDAGGIWQASAGCSIRRSSSLNYPVMPFLRPGRATHGYAAAE